MSCTILKQEELSARIEQYKDSPHSAFCLPASTHHWLICQNQRGPREFLVQADQLECDIGGMSKQQTIYLPPGTRTQWHFSAVEGSTHFLIPDKLLLHALSCERAFSSIQEQGPLLGAAMPRLSRFVNTFSHRLSLGRNPSDLAFCDLILKFAEGLARELSVRNGEVRLPELSTNSLGPQALHVLEDYMWENIERNITLAELAHLVHLSPFHFSRSFKQSTQITPHQALLRIRVRKARILLPESRTLTEIAYRCGFSDQAHFTRVFKAHTGFTPRQFRKATN